MIRAFVFLFLLSVSAQAQSGPPPVAAAGTLRNNGGEGCGAVLVAPDLVLTAAHCAEELNARLAVNPDIVTFATGAYPGHPERRFPIVGATLHPIYADKSRTMLDRIRADMAILRLGEPVPATVARPMPIAEAVITPGDRLIAAVWPPKGGQRASERPCGVVEVERWVLTLGCRVIPGDSGSPVLRKGAEGPELVGLLAARSDRGVQPLAHVVRAAPRVGQLRALIPPAPGS